MADGTDDTPTWVAVLMLGLYFATLCVIGYGCQSHHRWTIGD